MTEFRRPSKDPARFTAIYNVTLTNANTEYSQALPNGTRKLSIQCRSAVDIKYTTVAGQSGTNYRTLKAGTELFLEDIYLANTTIYLQTADMSSPVVEIEVWYS